nr:hypothetical protein [Nitrosomonas nitrosa]
MASIKKLGTWWRQQWSQEHGGNWAPALIIVIFFGLALLVVYSVASSAETAKALWSVRLVGSVLLAGGCTLIGALLGFLFGIPRSLQENRKSEGNAEGRPGYGANTNLEQISDWLTKIIVGVGLTQIGELGAALGEIGDAFKTVLGDDFLGKPIAIAIVIYFITAGFLYGYLWTRIFSAGEFSRSDAAQFAMKVQSVVDAREIADQQIVEKTDNILNAVDPPTPVILAEYENALRGASQRALDHVFQKTKDFRASSWRDEKTKPNVERTIYIFRALAKLDPKNHRYFGQLGYALKDQVNPNWEEAAIELTTAIRLRGEARVTGWALYEFNRAVARVHLYEMKSRQPDEAGEMRLATLKSEIVDDLKVAKASLGANWLADREVAEWLKANNIDPAAI